MEKMALTNSVIAPLPSAMEVDAAKVAFESFGEVFQVKRLEKFNDFVQVIFYDVRSAARALKAFGEAGCIAGPQVGDRTVTLAGDDQLSTKDFQKISEVLKSKDGAFFLEFYDLRDAMRYRTPKEKLTIDLPPGLSKTTKTQEVSLRAPPGLGSKASAEWEVILGHLPAKLLTEVMLEAVFQQASLEVLHFMIKNDKVLAYFENQINAQKCVSHFSGCQWDKSGTMVTAELIPPADAKSFASASGSKGLSAEAPAFQPYAPFDFSAEAPAFVPSQNLGPKVEETAEPLRRAPGKLVFGSDTSTEVGDSEDDEKTSPARVKMILSKHGARARSGSAGSV